MSSDRYAINEFNHSFNEIASMNDLDQKMLGRLLADATPDTRHSGPGFEIPRARTLLLAKLATSIACDAGRIILDFDIELRRTFAYLNTGSLRPFRERDCVEIVHAAKDSTFDITFAVSAALSELLMSTPLRFLLLLSWFWDHRLTHTRTLSNSEADRALGLIRIVDRARECVLLQRPARLVLTTYSGESSNFTLEPIVASFDIPE